MSVPYKYSAGEMINSFSTDTYSGVLVANTAQSLTVPIISVPGKSNDGNQGRVVVVIKINTTTTTIGAATGELVPQCGVMKKIVKIGDVLSFITSGSSIQYNVSFYQSV